MQKKHLYAALFCLALSMITATASANSGGSASATGGAATAKLEPFVVNLSTTDRYLQLSLTLQIATAEVTDRIKMLMPKVRHALIVILSGKEGEQLQSLEGKHKLMEEIKDGVNKTLDMKERDGVTDVFFENFVIQ